MRLTDGQMEEYKHIAKLSTFQKYNYWTSNLFSVCNDTVWVSTPLTPIFLTLYDNYLLSRLLGGVQRVRNTLRIQRFT